MNRSKCLASLSPVSFPICVGSESLGASIPLSSCDCVAFPFYLDYFEGCGLFGH